MCVLRQGGGGGGGHHLLFIGMINVILFFIFYQSSRFVGERPCDSNIPPPFDVLQG